jgi:hypothetical protein
MYVTPDENLLQTIAKAIRNLRFGTLEIVVHDSKVVRIERHERIRLDFKAENPQETSESSSV